MLQNILPKLLQRAFILTMAAVVLSSSFTHAMKLDDHDVTKHSLSIQPAISLLKDIELTKSLDFCGLPPELTPLIMHDVEIKKLMFSVSKGFYTLLHAELMGPVMKNSSIEAMKRALDPHNPRKLYIKYMAISSDTPLFEGVILPKGLLPQYPHLISLDVGKSTNTEGFFILDHVDISEYWKQTTSLQLLSLRNHTFRPLNPKFGWEPSDALLEALKKNTTLTSLDLSYNCIKSVTLSNYLPYTLQHNKGPNLKTLRLCNLSVNDLPGFKSVDSFIALMANAFKRTTTLTELNLEGNNIGDEAKTQLQEISKANPALQLKW